MLVHVEDGESIYVSAESNVLLLALAHCVAEINLASGNYRVGEHAGWIDGTTIKP